jgi:hypothetical protein
MECGLKAINETTTNLLILLTLLFEVAFCLFQIVEFKGPSCWRVTHPHRAADADR